MEWIIIFFFIAIITFEFTLIYYLCSGRLTIFDMIRPTDRNNSMTRSIENSEEIDIIELPLKEIPINPPNVVIIESPDNQINIGIKLTN